MRTDVWQTRPADAVFSVLRVHRVIWRLIAKRERIKASRAWYDRSLPLPCVGPPTHQQCLLLLLLLLHFHRRRGRNALTAAQDGALDAVPQQHFSSLHHTCCAAGTRAHSRSSDSDITAAYEHLARTKSEPHRRGRQPQPPTQRSSARCDRHSQQQESLTLVARRSPRRRHREGGCQIVGGLIEQPAFSEWVCRGAVQTGGYRRPALLSATGGRARTQLHTFPSLSLEPSRICPLTTTTHYLLPFLVRLHAASSSPPTAARQSAQEAIRPRARRATRATRRQHCEAAPSASAPVNSPSPASCSLRRAYPRHLAAKEARLAAHRETERAPDHRRRNDCCTAPLLLPPLLLLLTVDLLKCPGRRGIAVTVDRGGDISSGKAAGREADRSARSAPSTSKD
ncbi:hypothetical protein CC78DRAFT_581114 [Lojkania enalia]|uniref:Uncharacterized protein n=1 Tax=Lojkania enalia TaxID=147567 RepID=A0A9P4K9U6_9PLEO|nr:hypothetical protein CC78DRAFT_581114 [Didymosphaeria enalia]